MRRSRPNQHPPAGLEPLETRAHFSGNLPAAADPLLGNESVATATPITIGRRGYSVDHRLSPYPNDEADVFTFTLTARRTRVTATASGITTAFFDLDLFDAGINFDREAPDVAKGTTAVGDVLGPGTYFVSAAVDKLSGGTPYHLSITADAIGPTPDPKTSVVRGSMFFDADRDGVKGAEQNYTHYSVYLDDNANGQYDRGETARRCSAAGSYAFRGLTAGRHIVGLLPPKGFDFTTPGVLSKAAARGGTATINFGAYGAASISGTAFLDNDGDGVLGRTDTVLARSLVFLDEDGDGTRDATERATRSHSNGTFRFNGLGRGDYNVILVPSAPKELAHDPVAVHLNVGARRRLQIGLVSEDLNA